MDGLTGGKLAAGTAYRTASALGQMADAYELTVAPHNYYSHLADLHAIHLCAVLPTVKDVTGRAPRSFEAWARAHADAFR